MARRNSIGRFGVLVRILGAVSGLSFAAGASAQDSFDYIVPQLNESRARQDELCRDVETSLDEKLRELMCGRQTNADAEAPWLRPENWDEMPTDPVDAVWEAVFLPIQKGMSRRDLRRLGTNIGLLPTEVDVLKQYAIDAVAAEHELQAFLREEIVCSRQASFETPADWGRALESVSTLRRRERPAAVAGLSEVLGLAGTESVIQYAVSVKPAVTLRLDRAASFQASSESEQELIKDFACGGRLERMRGAMRRGGPPPPPVR